MAREQRLEVTVQQHIARQAGLEAEISAFQASASKHLAALTEHVQALSEGVASQVKEREAVGAHVQALQRGYEHAIAQMSALTEHVQALSEGVASQVTEREAVGAHVQALQRGYERTIAQMGALTEHVQALHSDVAKIRGIWETDLVDFKKAVSRHLDSLTQQLSDSDGTYRQLVYELRAIPYVSSPEALLTRDHQGRPAIGYQPGSMVGREGYRGFEDIFRGSESFIRERQRVYIPWVKDSAPILDVGCGRGEFLDLLADAGIPAVGVDSDVGMVARCQAKGHRVIHSDAVSYLADQPDSMYGTIFCAQVIEHLPYDVLLTFLSHSRRVLRPGGLLIAETVNPHALSAFKTFWVDLTHRNPVYPEVAAALCGLEGFDQALIIFPNGIGDLESDRWTQGEYAVVATKASV